MGFLRQNAIGLLALCVALSGTAYAAGKIGARDIERNAIRTAHIKRGQVKGSDLAGGLRKRIIRRGAPGARGPAGPPGPAASEQLQIKRVEGNPLFLAPEEFDGAPIAQCPAGYVVVGTGFNAGIGEPAFVLSFGSFVGGFFANFSSISTEANVQALCAKNSGGGATASKATAWKRFQRRVARARAAME